MDETQDFMKIYSEKVRAGRRVYFFDIKPTKSGDYYLVVTEKKKLGPNNLNEKHRIFLYKEDLNKFMKAIEKATAYMKNELMPDFDFDKYDRESINLLEEQNYQEEE